MTNFLAAKAQNRLNAVATRIETPQAFLDKFPDMKRAKADSYFQRYLTAVTAKLLPQLPYVREGETHISTEQLFDECSSFNFRGKRFYTYNEFKDIYPLFIVQSVGSNLKATTNPTEKNSRVKVVNERIINMLLEEKSPKTVYEYFFGEEDESNATGVTPIDMANLERFIGCTELELDSATGAKHRDKLKRNLWQARLVHKIGAYTEEQYDRAILPQFPSESAFGRVYYKGMSIQNVSKQVRSAILGHHFQYDMNAAVFAIKLSIYGQILGGDNTIINTPLGSYTREYLANKKQIRKKLAKHCFEGVELPDDAKVEAIKSALTAIGFGAKRGGSTWIQDGKTRGTALSEILMNKDARTKFEQDDWVKAFLAEQTVIEETILETYRNSHLAETMNAAVKANNNANGNVSRGGQMAWIYQQEERRLMEIAVEALAESNITPLAMIHDAFIVREKLSAQVLDNIAYKWGLRDYLSLDCDEIEEWIAPEFKRALRERDQNATEHRIRIMHEEQTAQKKAALKRVGWQ